MSFWSYIVKNPREAWSAFYAALTGTEKMEDRIQLEEGKLNSLRLAIGFYKTQLGHLPEKLEDLCFNNHAVEKWDAAFINWRGPATFQDSFGYPYQYGRNGDEFHLKSPGLDTAKECVQKV